MFARISPGISLLAAVLVPYGSRYACHCNVCILLISLALVLEHDRGPYFSLGGREWEAPLRRGGI